MSSKTRFSNTKKNKKQDSESEEEEEYEVEKILDSRINGKTKNKEYLIKWKNYDAEESTWEPQQNLENVKDIMLAYEKNQKKKETTSVTQSSGPGSSTRNGVLKEGKKKGLSVQAHSKLSVIEADEDEVSKEETKKPASRKVAASQKRKSVSPSTESLSEGEEQQQSERKEGANEMDEQGDSDEYVFEEIVDKRVIKDQVEYQIRFQNIQDAQWIDQQQLVAIKDDIIAYEQKLAAEKEQASSQSTIPTKLKPSKELGKHQIKAANTGVNSGQDLEEEEDQQSSKQKSKKGPANKNTAKRSIPFAEDERKQPEKTTTALSSQKQAIEKETVVSKVPAKAATNVVSNLPQLPSLTANSSLSSSSQDFSSRITNQLHRRQPIDLADVQVGDFKTDNVDKIELQGDFSDILSARFEVFWKTRREGLTPASQVYSASYLRRYEPSVLIDYLININHINQPNNPLQAAGQQNLEII